MIAIKTQTKVIENCPLGQIPEEIFAANEPVILKGIVNNWRLVELGLQSTQSTIDYLKQTLIRLFW